MVGCTILKLISFQTWQVAHVKCGVVIRSNRLLKNTSEVPCAASEASDQTKCMKNKQCRCGKAAQCLDGEAGDKAVGCMDCRASEMMNVTTRKCQCGKVRPIFGEVGGKAVCCKDCRKSGIAGCKVSVQTSICIGFRVIKSIGGAIAKA